MILLAAGLVAGVTTYLTGAGVAYEREKRRAAGNPDAEKAAERSAAFWLFFYGGRVAVSVLTAPIRLGRRLARPGPVKPLELTEAEAELEADLSGERVVSSVVVDPDIRCGACDHRATSHSDAGCQWARCACRVGEIRCACTHLAKDHNNNGCVGLSLIDASRVCSCGATHAMLLAMGRARGPEENMP